MLGTAGLLRVCAGVSRSSSLTPRVGWVRGRVDGDVGAVVGGHVGAVVDRDGGVVAGGHVEVDALMGSGTTWRWEQEPGMGTRTT